MKVLIVDAGPGNHSLTAEILAKRGCQLLQVHGGDGALRIARVPEGIAEANNSYLFLSP